MKVVLLQDVKSIGKKGELVNVSDGYARNFLIPRKLAVPATAENLNTMKQQEKAKQAQAAAEAQAAVNGQSKTSAKNNTTKEGSNAEDEN